MLRFRNEVFGYALQGEIRSFRGSKKAILGSRGSHVPGVLW